MNTIREIQRLNKLEIEKGVSTEGSWHRDFDDTAYIYIGGLPFDLSEGDIVAVFSQYGEPTWVKLVRDKDTGKSKGFAFLKYEDQRSTDLAVDNLGGAEILGRILKVDHTRYKKRDDDPDEEDMQFHGADGATESESDEEEEKRPMLKEEKELAALLREHDEEDPMKEYLVQEKKKEVVKALAVFRKKGTSLSSMLMNMKRMEDRGGIAGQYFMAMSWIGLLKQGILDLITIAEENLATRQRAVLLTAFVKHQRNKYISRASYHISAFIFTLIIDANTSRKNFLSAARYRLIIFHNMMV